jgi:predicted cupin superfamily sugar epimerase
MDHEDVIRTLRLQPLPREGGYYRETYRGGPLASDRTGRSAGGAGTRSISTAIYYLLTLDTYSAMHRLPGDEMYHHYLGGVVELFILHPNGCGETIRLGGDLLAGEQPQVVVPGGAWQGSRLAAGEDFALLGTTMSPGFEFADYTHGTRAELLAAYPKFRREIERLTAP